jgi:YegS/Rv2252/BmrU family lipid kinase
MKSSLFIINPVAGNGKGIEYIEKINDEMTKRNQDYDIYISENKKSIGLYLSNLEKKYDAIIGVGGDGTINDIVNNIYNKDIKIGIIPLGSGNDFLRNFDRKFDLNLLLDNLIADNYIEYDIWKANERKFFNVFSVGVDGEILISRNNRKANTKGKYLIMAIKKLIRYRTRDIEVKIDGLKINRKSYLFTVCNGSYFGSGMKIMPGAELNDGELDICIVNHCSKAKILFLFPSIYWGGHLKFKSIVEHYRAKEIEINCREKLPLDLDGEIIGETPVKIQISEEKMKMIKFW